MDGGQTRFDFSDKVAPLFGEMIRHSDRNGESWCGHRTGSFPVKYFVYFFSFFTLSSFFSSPTPTLSFLFFLSFLSSWMGFRVAYPRDFSMNDCTSKSGHGKEDSPFRWLCDDAMMLAMACFLLFAFSSRRFKMCVLVCLRECSKQEVDPDRNKKGLPKTCGRLFLFSFSHIFFFLFFSSFFLFSLPFS